MLEGHKILVDKNKTRIKTRRKYFEMFERFDRRQGFLKSMDYAHGKRMNAIDFIRKIRISHQVTQSESFVLKTESSL